MSLTSTFFHSHRFIAVLFLQSALFKYQLITILFQDLLKALEEEVFSAPLGYFSKIEEVFNLPEFSA